MNLFVSYTTRDDYINRELLEKISEVISEYGSHYIDLIHNDKQDKQRHVELMLSKSNLVLLIVSNSINESKWVKWELSEAKQRNIPIIHIQAYQSQSETINNLKAKLAAEKEKLSHLNGLKTVGCFHFVQHYSQQLLASY